MDKLYLIDANAFCYRTYFALGDLRTSYGQPTNAIYGFVNFLNKIFKQENPGYLAACFDVSRDTFRQRIFSEYKIQRPAMPEGLASQFPLIKDVLKAYGITIFEKEGFEADDVIASLTKKARQAGSDVVVISSDKDILQLVDEHVRVFSPYKDKGTLYDREAIKERFGIEPAQIADFIGLVGDPSDNIPGVKGLGPKTAQKLLAEFNSVGGILKNLERIEPEKLRLLVKENTALINLSRELATLKEEIELEFKPDNLKIKEPDYLALYRIFRKLEFKSLLKNLPVPQDEQKTDFGKEAGNKKISDFTGVKELIIFYETFLTLFAPKEKIILNLMPEDFDSGLGDLLSYPGINKVAHGLKELKLELKAHNLAVKGKCFDTMLAAYILNPSRSDYSVPALAWDYLNTAEGASTLSPARACGLIAKLKDKFQEDLEQKKLTSLFWDLEMPLVDVLTDMESAGVKIDLELLKSLSGYIETKLAGLVEKIFEISGTQFNINSPKQLRQVLFERLKLPVVKKTKSGASTDEAVLSILAKKHHLPEILLEYRKLTKIKSTYVDAFIELAEPATHKLHTSFNQAGTQTGRLSSSKPNLQNLPVKTEIGSQIRKAIIASDNARCLVSSDYSQIELRILAHISKDQNLISAFENGKDIHKFTASLIYGLDEKDITDPMREAAKRVNFGIIYGLSAFGLSRDLGIAQDQAQGFIAAYFLRYPQVKEYIQAQIKKARDDGFVTTILGRRRYIPEINNKNQGIRQFAERQAMNTPIQGSASDLIKLAMIKMHSRINAQNLQSKMILQIHDELLFDVPDDEAAMFMDLVRETMENIMPLVVPIKVEIKKGKNWLQMEKA